MRNEPAMHRTGDQAFIKAMNKLIVLNILRFQSPESRVQISAMTGLNKATVSSIVDELITGGLVFEVGHVHGKIGRRAVLLQFNAKAGYTVGVDLGVDYLRLALVDLSGGVLASRETKLPDNQDATHVVSFLAASIRDVLRDAPSAPLGLLGIGIGVPGTVDFARGVVLHAPNLHWKSVALKDLLYDQLNLPVYVDNEANVSALGEKMHGVGTEMSDMVYISAGTGIGTGIIVNGELVRGHNGAAGEFGHMTIAFDGPTCTCGNRGCLEVYASERALIELYHQLTGQRQTADEIIRQARAGQKDGAEAVGVIGHYLGIGVANLINGLSPSRVLIGNRLSTAGDGLLGPLREVLQSRCIEDPSGIDVSIASLGQDVCVIGASALVLDQYFSNLNG